MLVTDIDPRFLVESAALAQPQIEIQRHDIGTDPLPAREQSLERMVTALGPGGWLVVEDFDLTLIDRTYPTTNAAAVALFQKMAAAQDRLMAARSGELALIWGRSLYRRLRAHGLVNVGMEGYLALREGGSPSAHLMRANFEQIREEAINAGFITNEEVAHMLTLLDDPDFAVSAPVMCTAWGRRS